MGRFCEETFGFQSFVIYLTNLHEWLRILDAPGMWEYLTHVFSIPGRTYW